MLLGFVILPGVECGWFSFHKILMIKVLIVKIGKNKKQNIDFLSIIKRKNNLQKSTYMSTNKFPVPGQLSEKQQIFIDGLVKGGLSATAAARQAGYKQPKESAYYLTRSPRVVAAIRLARQTLYQTDLANLAAGTLKEVMQDQDAPPAARVSAARTALELSGDLDRGGAGGHGEGGERSRGAAAFGGHGAG